jgi:hypothetical protein
MAETKTLTKEEWARVEEALSGIYGVVNLRVDEFQVTFQRRLISKNRLGIVVYVGGEMKGTWFGDEKPDCPEQRYLYPHSRYVYTAKSRAAQKKLIKKWGKRFSKECGQGDPDQKTVCYKPFWPSATAIRRHYQKTFTSIELIEVVG